MILEIFFILSSNIYIYIYIYRHTHTHTHIPAYQSICQDAGTL
jgi:hypothetical protein